MFLARHFVFQSNHSFLRSLHQLPLRKLRSIHQLRERIPVRDVALFAHATPSGEFQSWSSCPVQSIHYQIRVASMSNGAARALAKLARGVPKRYSKAERERRRK